MPAATVLVPTHNHAETLRYSVASALRQTLTDFEMLIVGDGCDEATRAIARDLAASDTRVRFLDFPKGPRKGEVHRHTTLAEANGRIVAYLGDDDLWLPHHLRTLDELLREADFGHTLHAGLNKSGALFFLSSDLENAALRQWMISSGHNRFDFTFGGHTLAAYRRLPGGWHTIPERTVAADLHMWQQFLRERWCTARTAMVASGLCSQTHLRPTLTNTARAEELAAWTHRMSEPGFAEQFQRTALAEINRAAVLAMMARDAPRHDRDELKSRLDGYVQQASCAPECEARIVEQHAIRKAIKHSLSWRLTKPVRVLQGWLGKTPY